jgi:hypothetical protein
VPIMHNAIIAESLGKYGIKSVPDLIHEIFTCDDNFNQTNNFLWSVSSVCNMQSAYVRVNSVCVPTCEFGLRVCVCVCVCVRTYQFCLPACLRACVRVCLPILSADSVCRLPACLTILTICPNQNPAHRSPKQSPNPKTQSPMPQHNTTGPNTQHTNP